MKRVSDIYLSLTIILNRDVSPERFYIIEKTLCNRKINVKLH